MSLMARHTDDLLQPPAADIRPWPRPVVRPYFEESLHQHRLLFQMLDSLRTPIEKAAVLMADTLRAGRKIMLMGNGGSAADCQHLAAEFTGRFQQERRPLAAMALTTDTSALTCIGNDYGFEHVFERQLAGLGQPGDCAVGISTSGNSANVLRALERARTLGLTTVGLSGRDGGAMAALCDVCVVVPHPDTARIQEAHIFIGHCWCGMVEQSLAALP